MNPARGSSSLSRHELLEFRRFCFFITDAFSGSSILYGLGIFDIFPTFMLWPMSLKRRLENEETEQREV